MKLAVHIGNSSLQAAIQTGGGMQVVGLSSKTEERGAKLAAKLTTLLAGQTAKHSIVSSVCPEKNASVLAALRPFLRQEPQLVSLDDSFRLHYQAYAAGQLGIDRAIGCEAAACLAKPAAPFVMIDCGTATTLNVVNAHREFVGGMILPGLGLGLSALGRGTSLLPWVSLAETPPFIGRNTNECIQAGALHGNALLLDAAVARVWEQLGQSGSVVLTGGNSRRLHPLLKTHLQQQDTLLMQGLFLLLHRKNTGT